MAQPNPQRKIFQFRPVAASPHLFFSFSCLSPFSLGRSPKQSCQLVYIPLSVLGLSHFSDIVQRHHLPLSSKTGLVWNPLPRHHRDHRLLWLSLPTKSVGTCSYPTNLGPRSPRSQLCSPLRSGLCTCFATSRTRGTPSQARQRRQLSLSGRFDHPAPTTELPPLASSRASRQRHCRPPCSTCATSATPSRQHGIR